MKKLKMTQKNVNATGITLAFTLVILNLICLILLLLMPNFTLSLFGSFMHGIDLTKIAITPVIDLNTLIGIVVTFVGGYILGITFALIYNKLNR